MYKNIYVGSRQNDVDTINALQLHTELPRWSVSLAEFLASGVMRNGMIKIQLFQA